VTTVSQEAGVQIDGHLTDRTWRDPKTGTMLWILAIAYLGPTILVPLAIVALYVIARAG
jgi:hypothetical protein